MNNLADEGQLGNSNNEGNALENNLPPTDGNQLPGWVSQLSKDLRGRFEKANDLPLTQTELALAYMDLREYKRLNPTSTKFTETDYEEVSSMFNSGKVQQGMLKVLKENNVSPSAIKEFVNNSQYTEAELSQIQSNQKEAFTKAIKTVWGDKFEENNNYFEHAKNTLYNEEQLKNFKKNGLLNNVDFVNLLSMHGKKISEVAPNRTNNAQKNKADRDQLYKALGI